ncbi:16S rRNA (guanine(966)-N(2))-methyltransferase RsmD [Anaerobacillus isosaccharinicus]|uniref:16S rRNA (Guanine(966)-N(2))-methyltransferase RsmD n=1 Tax=Anaerobacillus isosaccharinicus TaxID=1532552 RepID=A0A1S2M9V5_9BACI|nr:16S rRNA (guanine(966)-N(2))-methyltransferase RsmD [Anaerobacillus isosaccharinicus]MBA5587461.1 16S rRNA (guanine(966)-N(2))-methyltransferase RsmD [Anaerobacillus isosaccharinicus]QOY34354.1 16S rRNA (guanine(966)-N(2))-methyltransferase RsmD [Anaerobacillus isosaccharinicus]
MRVISGTCKGRPLKAVPGHTTRPTTDKVKESIFNIIGPFFDGGQGLDLYAGSGGLGIEALSRGMEKFVFVDQNPKAIEIVQLNLNACRFEEKAELYRNDAKRALKAVAKRGIKFDVIFLDPPYAKQRLEDEIAFIAQNQLLTEEGIIVTEHDASLIMQETIEQITCIRQEQYGDTKITIFKNNEDIRI